HPELTDAQVARLIGTTKPTILLVRDRTHWNATNIKPQNPVTLGLCTEADLEKAVGLAQRRAARAAKKAAKLAKLAEAESAPSEVPAEQPGAEETAGDESGTETADGASPATESSDNSDAPQSY